MRAVRPRRTNDLAETLAAISFSGGVVLLGGLSLGPWVAAIFALGFVGGLIAWLIWRDPPTISQLRTPYWLTLVLFIAHRIEERVMGFFPALAKLTGRPTPDVLSWPVILMVLLAIGGWLSILPLLRRGNALGGFLAWTFFASMGVTELAHFVFPFAQGDLGYFPGMATVVILAPAAWWGLLRLHAQARHRLTEPRIQR